MVAILDNIRSVYNVGSIFRTADGAGADKLYLCGITPTPLNKIGNPRKKMNKVALGAEKSVEWEKKENTVECIKELKRNGFSIYAIEESPKSKTYTNIKQKPNKIALVFGNEVDGLDNRILEVSDEILEIPMKGKKKSLNVAVSFGVITYYFSTQIE